MSEPYDALAWFYERYWGGPFHEHALAALERLLFPLLSRDALILDACCGAGHLAARLVARGYRVVGVDLSLGMLRAARRVQPELPLVHGDARALPLAGECAAAVATFDAINHVTEPAALPPFFHGVRRALAPGAAFVFDALTEQAYREAWRGTSAHVGDDHACIVRGGYDPATRAAHTELTLFRREGEWRRTDTVVRQRCHAFEELERAAREGGFTHFEHHDAHRELGLQGPFAVGRAWCVVV